MIVFYLIESLLFLGLGLVLILKNSIVKKVINGLAQKDLFIIPGVLEIVLGLLTLYFRNQTRLTPFAFLIGILMFVDGVFYLLLSEKLKSTIEWILSLEDVSFKTYGLIMVCIAAGLGVSAFYII